jgi:hypothetical protein
MRQSKYHKLSKIPIVSCRFTTEVVAYFSVPCDNENYNNIIFNTDRDYFMSAEDAKNWGIVDKVM